MLPSSKTIRDLQKGVRDHHVLGAFHSASLTSHHQWEIYLRKESKYRWTESHQKPLQTIKNLICKEILLTYFDPKNQTIIQVNHKIEALLHEGKPVILASKSLMETEQRLANIEQELLAVVFGCEHFWTYIYGRAFLTERQSQPSGDNQPKKLGCSPTSHPTNAITPTRVWYDHCLSPWQINETIDVGIVECRLSSICVHACRHMCTYEYMYVCVRVCIHIHTHIYIYIYMCVCVCVCVCGCELTINMYARMCIYVYVQIGEETY